MDLTTADPLIGQLFDGRYRVDARVARGGMATVYTGFDTRLDRIVAIKVMHQSLAEDDAFVGRFHREAKAAARLSDPNVVAIYDQGADAGRVFLVMEHIDGGTLRERLRAEGRLSPAAALGIMEPVLHALAAAHDAGLVHRDVKPENILISSDGRVKVADFGLARAVETTGMTTTGLLIGTVSYLAPEQVSTGRADPRSDVYSAGIVLFELLTGAPPYDGDTPLSVAYRHVNDSVPAPSSILTGIPPELDEVILRATHRDPDARPATARDLLVGVRRAQQAVSKAGATTLLRPLPDALTTITPLPESRGAAQANFTRVLRAPAGRPPVVAAVRRRRSRRGPIAAGVIALVLLVTAIVGWQMGLTDTGKKKRSGAEPAASPSASAAQTPQSSAVVVPELVTLDVSGATFEIAKLRLEEEGFVGITKTEVFNETVKAGVVFDQDPKPLEKAAKGSPVKLVVSRGPNVVVVPIVAGLTRARAIEVLTSAKLKNTITEQNDEKIAEGLVISSNPVAGTDAQRDSSVALVISTGKKPIVVPVIKAGTTYDVAAAAITKAGLVPIRKDAYSSKIKAGLVFSQAPATGTLFRGEKVTLTVSKGPAPVAMPKVLGLSRTKAVARLKSLGLKVILVDYPGRKGGTVIDQRPATGVLVPAGSTVTIYLF
ncbi:MAG: Stk1 family PASTA domain-containing Ser/Thr kinase [Mycobacteriales bacterium]